MSGDLSFLLASDQPLPEAFFQGYFFAGTDFVQGADGYARYRRTAPPPLQEDGCYVVGWREGADLVLSTDYSGFSKLFHYSDGRDWVVSNSLLRMARYLRAKGAMCAPDRVQLAAMLAEGTLLPTGRGIFFAQMTTFDTVLAGVRLLPAFMALRLGLQGARPEILPRPPALGSYSPTLDRFVSTWAGRFASLAAQPDLVISLALTGGLDSRTVLALGLLGAGGDRLHLRSNTNARGRKDYRTATMVCAELGLRHNAPLAHRPHRLAGQDAFALWQDLSLGVDYAVFLPRSQADPRVVYVEGGGGENHRAVYGRRRWWLPADQGPEGFVRRRSRNLPIAEYRTAYAERLQQTFDLLQSAQQDNGVDPLVLHYRAFRNRIHAGRKAQVALCLNPLSSRLLDDCTAAAGSERFERNQVFFDIMASADLRLLSLPFDSWTKAPTRQVLRNLTPCSTLPLAAGQLHGSPPDPALRSKAKAGPSALDHLAKGYAAAQRAAEAGRFPARYLARADHNLRNGLSNPVTSKRVGAVLACGLFLD